MLKYEVTECTRGDLHFGPDSLWSARLVIVGILLTFLRATQSKDIISSLYGYNWHDSRLTVLPNSEPRKNEELERTWPASLHGTLHKCVSAMAAHSQKQVKVNNMNILDTNTTFTRATVLQCSQRNYDTHKSDGIWTSPSTCINVRLSWSHDGS